MRLNPVQAILCFVFTVHALPAGFGDLPSLLPDDKPNDPNQPQAVGPFTRLGRTQLPSLSSSASPQNRLRASHAGVLTNWLVRSPIVSHQKIRLDRLPPPETISATELESSTDGTIYYQIFSKDQVMKESNEKARDLLLASGPNPVQFDKSEMTNFIHGGLSLFGQKFVEMPVQDSQGLKLDTFAIQVDSKFVHQGTTCPCQVHFRDRSGRKSAVFVPYGQNGVEWKRAHTVQVDQT
ncbi:hypothetical protein EV360DRAFT_87662 [Lentinula raphanica]|nr:hypothetical protein EV360DRAFT_87662 [Lentinula raphanica]